MYDERMIKRRYRSLYNLVALRNLYQMRESLIHSIYYLKGAKLASTSIHIGLFQGSSTKTNKVDHFFYINHVIFGVPKSPKRTLQNTKNLTAWYANCNYPTHFDISLLLLDISDLQYNMTNQDIVTSLIFQSAKKYSRLLLRYSLASGLTKIWPWKATSEGFASLLGLPYIR